MYVTEINMTLYYDHERGIDLGLKETPLACFLTDTKKQLKALKHLLSAFTLLTNNSVLKWKWATTTQYNSISYNH